jgi:hypothetical protein
MSNKRTTEESLVSMEHNQQNEDKDFDDKDETAAQIERTSRSNQLEAIFQQKCALQPRQV